MTTRSFTIKNDSSSPLQLRCDIVEHNRLKSSLAREEISITGKLANSSNGALLGSMDIGTEIVSVVIKPAISENPLTDFEWGTLVKREVAAFELAQALGWQIVPPTVLRNVQEMKCSVQIFVPHDPRQHYFSLTKNRRSEMERFCVFDYIANNADRKAGHIIAELEGSFEFDPDTAVDQTSSTNTGRLWGIDHGICFHTQDKLRTVIWEFAEKPISEDLLTDVAKALPKLENALEPYLSEYEIERTVLRAEEVLMNPFHRALDAQHGSFPWPLV